ncbi:MAG TPA: ankyrin repeat domain-containing protein [Chthonomonadaceae bacterium]|nr:ankyrin repeat domain-containing protein [Chthonomonadaceae bacterium]
MTGLVWLVYAPIRQEKLNRALIAAIKNNDTQKALALLADGADPNSRDEPPQHLSLWRLLLDDLRGKRPALSDAPTALFLACSGSQRDTQPPDNPILVKALLDRRAAVEVPGYSPLLAAAYWDNTAVSTLLIEKGAKVNFNPADTDGNTPLLYAAEHSNEALIRLLVSRGADVNTVFTWDFPGRKSWYETPLMAAQWTNVDDPAITDLLLSRGAKVNGPDTSQSHRKWTPLIEAIRFGRSRSVRILLQHGADVNLATRDGDTALKIAMQAGDKQIVQMLKQAGAKK